MISPSTPEELVTPGCRSGLLIPIFIVLFFIGAGAYVIIPPLMQGLSGNPPAGPIGPGNPGLDLPIPPVSDRYFVTGTTSAAVTGDLSANGQVSIDPVASYAQDGLVWIAFHDGGTTEVLVVFNEPEDSVTVAQGNLAAIGRDDECAFDIEVTESSVSGTVSCASIGVFEDGERTGTASIEIQFSTATEPMEE